jgi:dihydroorotate dehydrogenase electron transfer subunit
VFQQIVRIDSNEEIAEGLFLLKFVSDQIAERAQPGQFVNVRAERGWSPLLLRRPFSISRVVGSSIELVFNVIGAGTRTLASKRPGEELDVLGPLGTPFRLRETTETALLVGGGLGVAPFPFLTDNLERSKVEVLTFVGSRTVFHIESLHLKNISYATDDGSKGYKGTVVECVADYLQRHTLRKAQIFGCGPTKMLAALSAYAQANNLECELSLEGDMACGIGICQGCPVERRTGKKKYALVCTEGPTFDCREIVFPTT